ncbi:hypothetical protein JY460_06040 [Stenotrophomonas maltophilia]|nr:hypothetical protein [Stenotrophomonas maltophilia]
MSGKHTPGPWVAYEIAPDDPDWGACEIWPAENDREDEEGTVKPVATMVMGVENARLIAAAPEMFEALDTIGGLSRALRQGGPDPMDLQGLSDALEEAVDLANSLVAQIEGRV